ncbi:NAD(P)H-binding protein [Agrobacterium tumefaciens]|uniref:NAD(P)H-binding protein n=1 Tax=Agrobacterium tumefaciens TaxID=358 RepID=UPI001AEEADF2|nr:NAD(P)H-binding protein [Agrobacterium tumefaciens]
MTKVFIVGGGGKVSRRLIRKLAARGHQILALHRKPEDSKELSELGAVAVTGNLLELDATQLADLMGESDVVVFSAGAGGKGGPEMTNAIDGAGLELSVAAARSAGIERFLLVSAFPESFRGKQMPASFENYMSVKKNADVHLAESELDWVILRPGTLLDDAGQGLVRAGVAIPYGDVSRDDVAETLSEIIDNPR